MCEHECEECVRCRDMMENKVLRDLESIWE